MYPPPFPQTLNANGHGFGAGSDASYMGTLPPWQSNPAAYASPGFVQQSFAPQSFAPQSFAPQGIFGSLLGSTAGRLLGGLAGQPDIGRLLGGAVGTVLPFQAGPQAPIEPQFDPQGFWSALKNVVSQIPQVVGTAQQVIGMLPLQAGPQLQPQAAQFDPQGIFNTLLKHLPQVLTVLPQLLPLQAGPQLQPQSAQFDPQGILSNFLKHLPPVLTTLPQVLTTLPQMLPFQAGPQALPQAAINPQFDPQGFWSSLKKVVSHIPQVVGTAQQVIGMLPLQAGPQPQLTPQGWGGDLLSQAAQTAGQNIGGFWGQALQGAAPLAQYLPFQAGPASLPQSLAARFPYLYDWIPNHGQFRFPLTTQPSQQAFGANPTVAQA